MRLFEAEFRRAAWTAAYMGAMAIAAALLAITAWLVLAASLVYAAVAAGAPWWLGALLVIIAHGVGAFLLVRRVQAIVERLTFAATRRTLVSAFRFRSSYCCRSSMIWTSRSSRPKLKSIAPINASGWPLHGLNGAGATGCP